jgi:hypothetical protein
VASIAAAFVDSMAADVATIGVEFVGIVTVPAITVATSPQGSFVFSVEAGGRGSSITAAKYRRRPSAL